QKDHIRNGLIRAKPYREFLLSYFQERKLPSELIAIPFLESSFNPRAHSKANALGVWQFMPFIASHFFPKRTSHMDYRSNIGVASVSAASLMAQNYRIMKSWDLAVTAYNSGTRHLRNTKRELGDFNINLETVIKHSDSKHFGFASKNFYSEFLALAHTLAYRDELFPELKHDARPDSKLPLNFYLSKCTQNLSKVLNETQLEDLIFHNHHIRDVKKNIDRGTIVTTKGELPSKRFLLIPRQRILKDLPKDWVKLLKNQSCSTR